MHSLIGVCYCNIKQMRLFCRGNAPYLLCWPLPMGRSH